MQAVQKIVTNAVGKDERPEPHGRVLFVTHSFPPSMEIGANSCSQVSRHLPLYGWEPIVLTIQDKYIAQEYQPKTPSNDDAKFAKAVVKTRVLPHPFGLYRWLKRLVSGSESNEPEESQTVEVGSTNGELTPPEGKDKLRSTLVSLLTIPDMHTGWLIPGVFGGLQAIRENKIQVIFSSAPCFTGHLVGFALAKLTGLPWVAHFRDPWLTAHQPGWFLPKAAFNANLRLEQMVIKRADRVVSVTEGHSIKLREAYPQYPTKFISIPNGFDSEEWKEIDRARTNQKSSNSKFTILYAGHLYAQRNPLPMFRALQSLIEAGEIDRQELQIDLLGWCDDSVGRGVPAMIAETNLEGCVNVVGPRNRQETLSRMTQADLLLLLAENLTIQIPGKTYEYLKAGRPILAFTSEGSLAQLIRSTGCGWSIDPADHEGIRAALQECYSQWRLGQVSHVCDQDTVARFDRRVTTGQIGKLLDEFVTTA